LSYLLLAESIYRGDGALTRHSVGLNPLVVLAVIGRHHQARAREYHIKLVPVVGRTLRVKDERNATFDIVAGN